MLLFKLNMDDYTVNYIKDSDVNEQMNAKLIKILSICFNDQPVFKEQRYFKEKPLHRWFIESDNSIIAHIAVHDKNILTEKGTIRIGGIAEVCVHPDYRGKGLVKKMLAVIHKWLQENDFSFAMLYGDADVYVSSGYSTIKNKIKFLDHVTKEWKIETSKDAMIAPLKNDKWPDGLIDINGPTF